MPKTFKSFFLRILFLLIVAMSFVCWCKSRRYAEGRRERFKGSKFVTTTTRKSHHKIQTMMRINSLSRKTFVPFFLLFDVSVLIVHCVWLYYAINTKSIHNNRIHSSLSSHLSFFFIEFYFYYSPDIPTSTRQCLKHGWSLRSTTHIITSPKLDSRFICDLITLTHNSRLFKKKLRSRKTEQTIRC